MTNFSSFNKKSKILTPENSLLFIPIIVGTLILSSLLGFVYRPIMKKLINEESKIKILNEKISYIPVYKKYINEISIKTNKAKKQQERLIEIISDPEELDTILSEINRICLDNQIEIIKVEPQPIIKSSLSKNNSSSISNIKKIKDFDPFLIPSIEKHVFKLTLKGEFNRLVDLLKELELLQTIAISDQIDIKSNLINSSKERLKLIMSFNLSTYAKVENKIPKVDKLEKYNNL